MKRKRIVAITTNPTGTVHTLMAADAVKKIAASLRKKIESDTEEDHVILSAEEISAADVVILAPEVPVERARFAKALIEAAAELARLDEVDDSPAILPRIKKFVAVTVCSDGIAHTFIAATSLRKAAKALGHEIKVEMQDSGGVKNSLTTEEIAAADAIIIASESQIDMTRFSGKPLYYTTVNHAIHSGREILATTLEELERGRDNGFINNSEQENMNRSNNCGYYKHLSAGISHMLPIMIAGGLCIALSYALGGLHGEERREGTLAWTLNLIGLDTAFPLFVAILSGFIGFSIAGRPALVPGLIGGALSQHLGAGFLGGIISGFLSGYSTRYLTNKIRLPDIFEALKPVFILPFLTSLLVGLTVIYFIVPPLHWILNVLVGGLHNIKGANALLFGMLLGSMMALDVGGPVNKAAFMFALGLLASKIFTPIATVTVAGMTPPLGLAITTWLFKDRFDIEERAAAGSAFVLGLSFITEGAIPFVAKNPLCVIPALVAGSAVAGGISMFCGVELLVPHGGLFAIVIPGAVKHLATFFMALAAGVFVTVTCLFFLKKPLYKPTRPARRAFRHRKPFSVERIS